MKGEGAEAGTGTEAGLGQGQGQGQGGQGRGQGERSDLPPCSLCLGCKEQGGNVGFTGIFYRRTSRCTRSLLSFWLRRRLRSLAGER